MEDGLHRPAIEVDAVKGFVQTPNDVVDLMVGRLFSDCPPSARSTVLDPGCGTGNFIAGVIRWCEARQIPLPAITGVELDPRHVDASKARFAYYPSVRIEHRDFLTSHQATYDYVVGNPPYVSITQLGADEKQRYRTTYSTASGRFDLYLLFFEQALRCLKSSGKLVLITPEKFLYVETAAPLRRLLASKNLEELLLLQEDVFGELVTYPTVTVLTNQPGPRQTKVVLRNGRTVHVVVSSDGSSWLPLVNGRTPSRHQLTLIDICRRVSCGVATGADSVFVKRLSDLDPALHIFGYPTLAGRELMPGNEEIVPTSCMLAPYARDGSLLATEKLHALGKYLSRSEVRQRLERRTCVARKPWYAFHETPVLDEILRPKILCKDITAEPHFWIDREGTIVPRHSVYYIVPDDSSLIDELADYLNSSVAREWLWAHCQRASKGFLRIQSRVLKKLPVPQRFASKLEEAVKFRNSGMRVQSPALVAPE